MIPSPFFRLFHTLRHWWQELLAVILFLILIPIGLHALSRFPSAQENALTHLNRLQEALFHLQLEQQRLQQLHIARFDALFPLMSEARHQSMALWNRLQTHPDLIPLAQQAHALHRDLIHQLPYLNDALRHQTITLTSHRHFTHQGEQCLTRLLQLTGHDHNQLKAVQHYYLLLTQLPFKKHHLSFLTNKLDGFNQAINSLLQDSAPSVCQATLQHGHQMIQSLTRMDQQLALLHLNQLSSRLAALRHDLEKSIHRAMVSFNGLIAVALLIALSLTYLLVQLRLRLHREARQMTERTHELQRLNRLYDTLLSINHALLNTEEEETLSHLFARAFTQHMRLPAALVFHLPPHAPRESAGLAPAHISQARKNPDLEARLNQLRLHPHPQHPDHLTCLRPLFKTPGHLQVIDRLDLQSSPELAPWRPMSQTHDFNQLIFLSLHRGGESTRHIIVLFLRDEDRFCEQAHKLIHNALAEAGYALENLHIRRMRDQQQAFLRLTEAALNTHEGLAMLSREGDLHWVNEAFTRLTGYQKRELLRRSPAHLFETESAFCEILRTVLHHGRWQGKLFLRHKTGQRLPTLCTFSRVHHQKDLPHPHIVLMVQDMRPIQALEDRLQETLTLDPVTRLPNRQTLIQQLDQLIQPHPDRTETGLIAIINLRNFRSINDSLGTHAGDHFLQEVARRLKQIALPHLTGRDHNDEFILAPLTLCTSQVEANQLWETLNAAIRQALTRPFHIHGTTITLADWYAGVTFYTTRHQGLHFDAIVQEAETAVRKARAQNRPVAFYSTVFNRAARRSIQMSEALIQAIEQHDFTLHYQPIVSCHDQRTQLCEALLRWRWNGTPVSPEEFIPLLESRPALMIRVGRWILQQAIADMARLNAERPAGHPPVGVSINLSGIQLQDDALPEQLARQLHDQNMPAHLVTLEITESTLIEDIDTALSFIERCRKTGVEIAIDDFGTGYSSLEYLQAFNADKIKLDKAFVQTLDPDQPRTRAIPEMTISMAHTLGARLVAEGVETPLQSRLLREMGCDYLQGFLFGRGMPLDELEHFIRNEAHDSNLADHRHTGQRQDHPDSTPARPASSS